MGISRPRIIDDHHPQIFARDRPDDLAVAPGAGGHVDGCERCGLSTGERRLGVKEFGSGAAEPEEVFFVAGAGDGEAGAVKGGSATAGTKQLLD